MTGVLNPEAVVPDDDDDEPELDVEEERERLIDIEEDWAYESWRDEHRGL